MRTVKLLLVIAPIVFLSSCVSSKKFKAMDSAYKQMQNQQKDCQDQLKAAQDASADLTKQAKDLQTEVDNLKKQNDFLKQNNAQILNTLQDMSVLSKKQADNVQQTLQNINEKDNYIKDLTSAVARKDSLNLALVTNLKSALADVNDKDINIKVDKGVIYVDISDKLLFNSGKYTVTPAAKTVLGKVAQVLNANPDIDFLVEGHTDNKTIHTDCIEDNWDLSVKRATSVVRILQDEYHIDPKRITAGGRSEYEPVADNSTNDGRAQNRRTRIVILPQMDQFFKLMEKK